MRRIISFLAVAALMVAMLIVSAMPAFAKPSFTPSECNAGGGNGAETILNGDGDVTECDPGNSGTTRAADNDELEDDDDDGDDDDDEDDDNGDGLD
jgi:hypothetical protein